MKQTDSDQKIIDTLRSLKTNEEVNPSVFFKENTKVRLMNLISDEEKVLEKQPSFIFVKNPKFAFRLAGIFLIILVFISTGTILAAQSANPKNTLYPVKLASEEIALKLSSGSSLKANIAVEIAKRRGDEITLGQKSDSKSQIKQGIGTYRESINQARVLVPSNNTHLNNELKNEENNLDELTHRYEDSGQTENQINSKQKVEGASDSNTNPSGQNPEQQKSEVKSPVEQQINNQETTKEEPKIQSSPSESFDKTIQDIRDNVEKSVQDITATPSPLSSPEQEH